MNRQLFLPLMISWPGLAVSAAHADVAPPQQVLAAQRQRITTVQEIRRPTLAILDARGQGVGSGVVISPDGYALTNFHVWQPCGTALKCGMMDGRVYEAVIVGLDPTGDVALIKLFGRDDFPAANVGDSDQVRTGDWAYVVGNPFLLADDFQPTVTYGIISGVHRYQYPAGTLLEYADCIQTDAAINPGNSGGPLFNEAGQLIGINGRGSFEKRGRVNVGVGYAISMNQIQRFLPCLKSGRIVDHASLGATVTSDESGRVVVDEILESSDAYRRGLRYDDEIVRFDGRLVDSVNDFKNKLGTYPNYWRVPLTFRRGAREYECLVRLTGYHRENELIELLSEDQSPILPEEQPEDELPESPDLADRVDSDLPAIVADHYEERVGFANYWFNRYHQDRSWKAFSRNADQAAGEVPWNIVASLARGDAVKISVNESRGTIEMPVGQSAADFQQPIPPAPSPPNSGGLLHAIDSWRRLLVRGPEQFGQMVYLGRLPTRRGEPLAECLLGNYQGSETRFYFDAESGQLLGLEFFAREDTDPCEIYFQDWRDVNGSSLPYRWEVHHGDEIFAVLEIETYDDREHNTDG